MSRPQLHIAAKIWSIGFILLLLSLGLRGLWLAKVDGNNLFHKFRLDRLTITTQAFDQELSQYAGGDTALFHPLGTLNYQLRKRALSRKILPGKADWLFLWSDQTDIDPLEQRLGLSQLSPLSTYELVLQYQQRASYAAKHNSQYLLVLAPNKASIYGEYLPTSLRLADRTFLDALAAALQNAKVPVLDLRPSLQVAKKEHLLYYRHDTHWNKWGAWHGTQAIMDHLALGKLPFGENRLSTQPKKGGDQIRMARLRTQNFADTEYEIVGPDTTLYRILSPPSGNAYDLPYYSQHNSDSGAKVLLIHDSFGHEIRPWLSHGSKELLALWAWGEFRPKVVQDFKPEIIVDQVIERNLAKPFPGNQAVLLNDFWQAHWPARGSLHFKSRFSLGQLQAMIQSKASDQNLLIVKLILMAKTEGSLHLKNGLRVQANYAFGEGENTLYLQINPQRPFEIELEGEVQFLGMELNNIMAE